MGEEIAESYESHPRRSYQPENVSLERFKKYCSRSVLKNEAAVFLGFDFV